MAKDAGFVVPYVILCTIILILLTTFLLRSYAHISVPGHARKIVWLSWTLCFCIVYILPLDLSPGVTNFHVMKPFYIMLYWMCFFLTWVLTPFQNAFIKSGGFSTKERLLDAVGLVLLVSFLYLMFVTEMSASSLGAVLQALGNLWGLSFAIMTMGYGLVEIPRYFWFRSSMAKRLEFLYFKCWEHSECRDAARDRVDELLYLWKKAKTKQSAPVFVYEFAAIDAVIPHREMVKIEGENKISHPDVTFEDVDNIIDSGTDFNRKHLVRIHMLFKIWLFELERAESMLYETVNDIFYTEQRLNASDHPKDQNSKNSKNSRNSINSNSDRNEMELYNHSNRSSFNALNHDIDSSSFWKRALHRFEVEGIPILSKMAAVLFGAVSVAVIWSEGMIIFDFFGMPYLSIFALIKSSLNETSTFGVMIGAMLFMYLSSCSLFALWRIHINKDYHMNSYGLTDSASMLTNAAFSMRFMFPLGLNLLMLFVSKSERDEKRDEYPYLSLFHDMSGLPLIGDPVSVVLPMLVILFCAATYFNVYGKVMKKLRISRFEFGDPASDRNVETRHFIKEGQAISGRIKKEIQNDAAKRRHFQQLMDHRFRPQNPLKMMFPQIHIGRNGISSKSNSPPHDDLANVSLMNQSAASDMQHIGPSRSSKSGRKLEFIELEKADKE